MKYENETWELMKNKNNSIKPTVSDHFYRNRFYTNFKLSFGYPRSDTCQTCDNLVNLISTENDENIFKKMETEKLLHQSKADVFYSDLRQRTDEAKVEGNKIYVLAFNYQQNMPLPHIPCGDVFYKRQLWVYNFCIHSARTGKSYFFMYYEVTAHKRKN